jgi:DNA-directed RNA polymerase subunit E'/Rpb7
MEQVALFEEKVFITPKDMNTLSSKSLDTLLLEHLREKLEGKCSSHGYVIPNTLSILSRSMGHIENGRYTGNVIFHIQAQGNVYNPSNGVEVSGKVLKKNKMGLYVIHNDAIRILIPRDLHIGNEEFEAIQPDDNIRMEIRKSRFQINDLFILSIGIYLGKIESDKESTPGSIVPIVTASTSASSNESATESLSESSPESEENEEESATE